MTTVYHMTNEPLDLNALTVIGVSVKSDETAIGQFGSGFKKAVAGILRNGGSVYIEDRATGRSWEFYKSPTEIRGKPFDLVHLVSSTGEDVSLNFTTDMASHWEPWMLFRELHANTLDEGGKTAFASDPNFAIHVTVEGFPEYADCAKNVEKYFNTRAPSLTSDYAELIPNGNGSIFVKNVLVAEAALAGHMDVNLPKSGTGELTEDRTLVSVKEAIYRSFNFSSEIFAELLYSVDNLQNFPAFYEFELGQIAKIADIPRLPVSLQSEIRQMQEAQASRAIVPRDPFPAEAAKINAACEFLHKEFAIPRPENIRVHENSKILGRFNPDTGITISTTAIAQGQREIAKTILEEYIHSTGPRDYTRDFQEALLELAFRNRPI